jgi:Family of unknown function (DUF6064)
MSEWWTYTLSDFLLFSPRVYHRLFELHNRELWPAQVLTVALGLAILVMLLRPVSARQRIIPVTLGALWIWIAWAFFWERYATINWASVYVAPVFGLEGFLLVGSALGGQLRFGRDGTVADLAGVVLFVLALGVYPLLALLMGRPWLAAEIFGVAPDPTTVATLAVLALAGGRVRWLLMIIPLLWCAVTGLTLWTMEANDFFVAPGGALAAVGIALLRRPTKQDGQGYASNP